MNTLGSMYIFNSTYTAIDCKDFRNVDINELSKIGDEGLIDTIENK